MKKRNFSFNGKARLLFFLIITIFVSIGSTQAQNNLCGFDKLHQKQLKIQTDYQDKISENEKIISSMRNNRSGNIEYRDEEDVISIPTVVHVIYTDSAYTNISDQQIYSAIDALNDDFRKVAGTQGDGDGVDTEIEFCLAQYDEWGNPTDGINRVHCTGNCAMGYDTIGISPNINEDLVKDLSRWPNDKYYNIWIVHKIGDPISDAKGFAYMPGVSADLDGAVILYSAFGIGAEFDNILDPDTRLNRTITHETGHYLNLYNTFEGDMDGTQCPPNNNCNYDGDKCCDTDPHIRSDNDCDENGANACNNGSPNSNFVHNYMDHSSEVCKSEFTIDQSIRMWDLLTYGSRKTLLESEGCEMEGIVQSCINPNVGFEEFSGIPAAPNTWHAEFFSDIEEWNAGGYTTPWYCYTPSETYVGVKSITNEMYAFLGNETFVTDQPFYLESGKIYEISFDYSVQKSVFSAPPYGVVDGFGLDPIERIVVGFTANPIGIAWNSLIAIVVNLYYPQYNLPSSAGFPTWGDYFYYPGPNNYYENLYPVLAFNVEWEHHSILFTYNGNTGNQYLNVIALNNAELNINNNAVYFDNVCLNENPILCDGTPQIDYSISGCSVDLYATSTGQETDLVNFIWDFGDGSPFEMGEYVNHEYMWDGEYTVCVTMDCGSEKKVKCSNIVISNNCDACDEYVLDIEAQKCEETGSYIANFTLDNIPEGYTLCNPEDGQAVFSEQGNITTNSYVKNEYLDRISFSISITPDDPDFKNDISINITLCDLDGNPKCYKVISSLDGDECDECHEGIISQALCNSVVENGGDTKYDYYGSVTIPHPLNSQLCETYSEESGFRILNIQGDNISYKFSKHTNKPFKTNAMFVYCKNGLQICYNVTIEVIRNCPEWDDIEKDQSVDDLQFRSTTTKDNVDFDIYPNPVSKTFYINNIKSNNIDDSIDIEIVDYYGRKVYNRELQDFKGETEIDVSKLSTGLYFVRIIQNGNIIKIKKIVIID